jgi:ADP-ribosylglycohydrolase
MKEKYAATLLGCALGDTLGMGVEGWKREQIRKYVGRVTKPIAPVIVRDEQGNVVKEDEFGKIKYYSRHLKKGDYTDDTIFTLAIAESIAELGYFDLGDVAKRHLQEYEARLKPDDTMPGGFGRTTVEGIKNLQRGKSPLESGVIGGPGNAPAMKMHPIGLYMDATGENTEGMRLAELAGKITHLDPRSVVSGVVQAYAVYALLQGVSREDFVSSTAKAGRMYEKPVTNEFSLPEAGDLTSRLDWIKENKDADVEEAFAHLKSSSLVFESFPFTLFMFQKYWGKPVEGLIETVNYGGDCDTTGAIYGALCGAKNGMVFPKDWTVDRFESIRETGEKIWELKKS